MLKFDNIKFKKEKSILGIKLEERIINKFDVKELDLSSVGTSSLKRNARFVFEIGKIEGNSVALLFVNNDYKVKLGVSSLILSSETLKDLSIIIDEFQRIVDEYVEIQKKEEEINKNVEKINSILDVLSYILLNEEEDNDNE